MLQIARSLAIVPYYQICLFYDSGNNKNKKIIYVEDGEKNNVYSIINDPDIEKSMFDVERYNDNPSKIIGIITKNKTININNFKKETIEKDDIFVFSINRIKENSTKPEDKINLKINDLINQVKEFMLK